MMELLRNAWLGWQNYIEYGKLTALLMAALFFLWWYKKGTAKKAFCAYAAVMTVLCMVPVTAALLMFYQTKFYDYEWIWSAVPVTAVIAYGMTLFLAEVRENTNSGTNRQGMVPVVLLCLAVMLLCGGFGNGKWDSEGQKEQREIAGDVVEQLEILCPEEEICLWAPAEILEYAREKNADITLLYGRNMWDLSLNGYSYDGYDETIVRLYEWMEQSAEGLPAAAWGEGGVENLVREAKDAGVNCVILPADTDEEVLEKVQATLGAKAQLHKEYWIIYE